MAPRKSDVIPDSEAPNSPTPEPAVQPAQLAALHRQLRTAEERLVLRLEQVRSRLRDVRPSLGEELAHTHTFLRQQHPGSEMARLTSRASAALQAVAELTDAVADARVTRETALALVARVAERLSTVQAEDMVQLEYRETMQTGLVPVKVACSTLAVLIERAAPLLTLGRACAARVAQSCLTVGREFRVEQLRRRLDALRLAVLTARTPTADDAELASIVQSVERQLEARLHVPSITWPKSGDPFAPPTLTD